MDPATRTPGRESSRALCSRIILNAARRAERGGYPTMGWNSGPEKGWYPCGHGVVSRQMRRMYGATSGGASAISSVIPGDGSLTLVWTAPANNSGSAITAYNLRYVDRSRLTCSATTLRALLLPLLMPSSRSSWTVPTR